VEQVSRWWNGNFGRLGRRDVYLRRGTLWEVEAREGGAEGRSKVFRFDTEDEAMDFLNRCLEGPGDWRQLSVSTSASTSASATTSATTSTSTPAPTVMPGATNADEPQDTDRRGEPSSRRPTG
jgi:hypothetical protein